MLMPSIFRENLLDDFFGSPFRTHSYETSVNEMMKTDVKEKEGVYELEMELPGYKKEDVTAQLKNGYLTISASKNTGSEEKDEKGNYIRRERYCGQCARSFYVGEEVRQEDIKARFENGILMLSIPKEEPQKPVEENTFIAIEG